MNLDDLKKIIIIFESSSLSELEIEEKGVRFRLVKRGDDSKTSSKKTTLAKEIEITTAKKAIKKINDREISIKSPLVGTFYRAHTPGEESFVEIDQYITAGQTLCIIDAMKVMNEITSEIAGKVKKILVENGQPVEYDQELFIIEKEE